MYKKSASVATIAAKSLVIYFEKLPMFLKYLAVPVLLQILGGVILGIGMFMIATKAIGGGGAGAMMIGINCRNCGFGKCHLEIFNQNGRSYFNFKTNY